MTLYLIFGSGSPPRAWGQFRRNDRVKPRRRFTPTGVGTMIAPVACTRYLSVHPHGRGDNQSLSATCIRTCGSPPRAWGQCARGVWVGLTIRFTPTGVGTIWYQFPQRDLDTVHPHGRGDNAALPDGYERDGGSPPRAWGQFYWLRLDGHTVRFTPTGVGTMRENRHQQRSHRGSPPRAWGQFLSKTVSSNTKRFTPTGVGTITLMACRLGVSLVHPHGRGDNRVTIVPWADRRGSPPRAWGQSPGALRARMPGRFTPTGVGTIPHSASATRLIAVHPHGRGDNQHRQQHSVPVIGSPPRAWGQ